MPVEPHAVNDREIVRLPERQVIDTIGRRRVHDARAIVGADEISG
jgi:hypothetical protein